MIFNSKEFALFLPVVFILYWFVFNKTTKGQNLVLLLSSLVFYGWADWRFLFLILLNAILNYLIGIKIYRNRGRKVQNFYLWAGVVFNLGVLGFFKYFNFFYDNFVDFLSLFGAQLNHSSLALLLPLGISFFTFQTLGYIIDIYNEEIEPSRDIIKFSTYVLYFPKLLAGPIERAQRFLPQISKKRYFDDDLALDGMKQILWGLFAKIVIADSCSIIVNEIFNNYTSQSGAMLLLGAFYYMIQIYCDFAGYSNIALGVSKLFGIRLMINFATPFFSTNISDFWKRWHISLTTWLMDYVFTPLSFIFRKYKKFGLFLAILITFILVGFWHGAQWTFIIFGALQGLYFIPLVIKGRITRATALSKQKHTPTLKEGLQMFGLFFLMVLTVVFFRAENTFQAFQYISGIFSPSLLNMPDKNYLLVLPVIALFILAEWYTRGKEHALQISGLSIYIRWSFYLLLGFILVLMYDSNTVDFIYLQF